MKADQAELVSSYADGTIGVTIKYGKSYEDTWAVFRGTVAQVRALIIDYFGFESKGVTGLSLSDLVVNATNLAHGKGNIAAILDARIIPSDAPPSAPESAPADDPWAAASASQPEQKTENGSAWILGEIEKQSTLDDLKKLWAANQAMFADAAVMAAYKARGRALKSA
ncbi:hypothetical protein [Actinacidiphila glaucinigra]|uniref:Uncharacterized protein n=1 Tax=Actinacidiphila glaucinigra TaxID=235986 RepID=A0A239F282_9ACTN|nr:hypothetical protein [Actinacidiphila glaucinigra]SNS50811.1 hypothetical protein SAMN05216252_106267 [Actinacidiphila glaucinigra]